MNQICDEIHRVYQVPIKVTQNNRIPIKLNKIRLIMLHVRYWLMKIVKMIILGKCLNKLILKKFCILCKILTQFTCISIKCET